jgi:hypothetical protein
VQEYLAEEKMCAWLLKQIRMENKSTKFIIYTTKCARLKSKNTTTTNIRFKIFVTSAWNKLIETKLNLLISKTPNQSWLKFQFIIDWPDKIIVIEMKRLRKACVVLNNARSIKIQFKTYRNCGWSYQDITVTSHNKTVYSPHKSCLHILLNIHVAPHDVLL